MPKNQVKTESSEPYTERARLGGPIPVIGLNGKAASCRMKLSSNILTAAGLGPNHEVELSSPAPGEIRIRRLAGPKENIEDSFKPRRTPIMDDLMDMTRDFEARHRPARASRPYPAEDAGEEQDDEIGEREEDGTDTGDGLSDEQRRQEEL